VGKNLHVVRQLRDLLVGHLDRPFVACGKDNLPKHAQEIYKEAFNSAEDQYGEEGRAHATAWSAVEQKYEKNDQGNWVQK